MTMLTIERPLKRIFPPCGTALTINCIRGEWHPSGAVAGMGVFAVRWSKDSTDYWAALHDFAQADQLRLVECCRSLAPRPGFHGASSNGGAD
jgi:hypothetical protein